jgi:hypothetical protein
VSNGLQDLLGQAARLRAECSFTLSQIGAPESLTDNVHYLRGDEHGAIYDANTLYVKGVKEHLQHAAVDIESWHDTMSIIQNSPS